MAVELALPAVEDNSTRICCHLTGKNTHEGRLARAVLPHQCVDLAGSQFEVHIPQGNDSTKRFLDPSEFHDVLRHITPLLRQQPRPTCKPPDDDAHIR